MELEKEALKFAAVWNVSELEKLYGQTYGAGHVNK